MLFCLKTPKHFYIRGSLTLVKGLNILEKLNTFVYQPLWESSSLGSECF